MYRARNFYHCKHHTMELKKNSAQRQCIVKTPIFLIRKRGLGFSELKSPDTSELFLNLMLLEVTQNFQLKAFRFRTMLAKIS